MKIPTTRSKDPVVILRTVAKAILQEAKRYNQGVWVVHKDDAHGYPYTKGNNPFYDDVDEFPSCGTVGCIAGWATVVTGNKPAHWNTVEDDARLILGLDLDSADELFNGGPAELTGLKPGTKEYAKAGVERVRNFVKTYFKRDLGI